MESKLSDAPKEKDDATALKEFLLDIECLDSLTNWTSKFNLFDILKISRVEIRHSNMLSWLLDTNENHGLGDRILRGVLQYYVTSFSDEADIFGTLLMECHDFSIQREWHNIDILAVSPNEQVVLCIENKIDSGEHDNQLDRYKRQVDDAFPGYKRFFIFLSPEGSESSDPDNWCSMSYEDILRIIDSARKKVSLLPEVQLLIDNYSDTIRRDIVGDKDLARICAEIYAKHQKALDLIFENKPDRATELAKIFRDWATMMDQAGEIIFFPDKSGKTCTRFQTAAMSKILPDLPGAISGWGTSSFYYYEIKNYDGREFNFQFVLSSKDLPSDLRTVCDRINKVYPAKQQKDNWQWRTPFSTRRTKVDEELSQETIFEHLNKRFEELHAFETKLLNALQDGEKVPNPE